MKMAESLVALYIYIYISILLQKQENTRENSLGKIGFNFDAIKKENIEEKRIDYKSMQLKIIANYCKCQKTTRAMYIYNRL